jgi:hypothetical protein
MLAGELEHPADDVVWSAGDAEDAAFVALDDGPCGLVGALGQQLILGEQRDSGATVRVRGGDAACRGVGPDGVERHTAPVNAPAVHHHRVELRGDPRLEDGLVMGRGNADAVVDHGQQAAVTLTCGGDEDPLRMRVTRIAQEFHDDILHRADVMLRLASLGLGRAQSDVPLAEALLDLQVRLTRDGSYEVQQVVVVAHVHSLYRRCMVS